MSFTKFELSAWGPILIGMNMDYSDPSTIQVTKNADVVAQSIIQYPEIAFPSMI